VSTLSTTAISFVIIVPVQKGGAGM